MDLESCMKSCPFCGGSDLVLEDGFDGGVMGIFVYCQRCFATGPLIKCESLPIEDRDFVKAIGLWNIRNK